MRKNVKLLVIMLFTIFLFTACAEEEMLSEGNMMTPTVGLTEMVKPTNTPSPIPTSTPSPTPTSTPSPTLTSTPSPSLTELPPPTAHTIYEGTTVELAKAKVGDVVLFGTYEQDNIASNGAEAIPWYILDKDGDKLLLMSVYLLDCVQYHEKWEDITWEDCRLRQWMNDDFYNVAFTESEKKYVQTSYLENADNPCYDTEGGDNTQDKVFALSLQEAEQCFGIAEKDDWNWRSVTPELSAAKVTTYAKAQGVRVSDFESIADKGWWWWLRSPGFRNTDAVYVDNVGNFHVHGDVVEYGLNAARPALWLNLKP